MSTRGFITIVIDGCEKTSFNLFDSYPSGLGADILAVLRTGLVTKEKARALRLVSDEETHPLYCVPSPEDVTRIRAVIGSQRRVSGVTEWSSLLYHVMGDLKKILEVGVIRDSSEFPRHSLWAEWGYVIDLDHQVFEMYHGFQSKKHSKGRFASRMPMSTYRTQWWPVALVESWPLDALPTDDELITAGEIAVHERDRK